MSSQRVGGSSSVKKCSSVERHHDRRRLDCRPVATGRQVRGRTPDFRDVPTGAPSTLRSPSEDNHSATMQDRLWNARCHGGSFFGFLRLGEVTVPSDTAFDEATHITFTDVAVDRLKEPTMVRARLKTSKTDPFRKGVDVVVGKTRDAICPVSAVLNYLLARGAGPGPLFRFKDGKPLTKARFVSQVREALQTAGIDGTSYSGHSFRSGAATAAAKAGVEDSTIKTLGRWKSDAYQVHIKIPRHHLAAVSV